MKKQTLKLFAVVCMISMLISMLTACSIASVKDFFKDKFNIGDDGGDVTYNPGDNSNDGSVDDGNSNDDNAGNGGDDTEDPDECMGEHIYDNDCDTDCNNEGCSYTRTTEHVSEDDDGDCNTAILCSVCDAIITPAMEHSFDNDCDIDCNNEGCSYTRTTEHVSEDDDGDCNTAILCSVCDAIITHVMEHSFDNDCDIDCNNEGCSYTRVIEHIPAEDDGDCTTAVFCSVCNAETTAAQAHSFDNNCDMYCNNSGCSHYRTITHTPEADDGNCETAVRCSVCGVVWTAAKEHSFENFCDTDCNNEGCLHTRVVTNHFPRSDDGDCTTPILCLLCNTETTAAKQHSFDNNCDTDCNNEGCNHIREVGNHADTDSNGKCDECEAEIPNHECTDADGDKKCDIYGEEYIDKANCKHPKDEDDDGYCDVCGKSITLLPSVPIYRPTT